MHKFLKQTILLSSLFIIFLLININSYSKEVSANLCDNFFRLHIIANSNISHDQNIKLKLRDYLIEYLNENNLATSSKEITMSNIKSILPELTALCNNFLKENNIPYTSKLEIGTFYFPTKHYENISLPKGYYDALKISLGNASGENWWCSLYPPLCFFSSSQGVITDEADNNLSESLPREEYNLIKSSSKPIKLKFKLLELF